MKRALILIVIIFTATGCHIFNIKTDRNPVNAKVNRIIDGDTITVDVTIGTKHYTDKKVRIMFIDTPEVHDNSHGKAMPEGISATELLKKYLSHGDPVTLLNPSGKIQFDRYRRLLAIVVFNNTSIEDIIISEGYSVLWRKYGDPPEPYLSKWKKAEENSRLHKKGCWASAHGWMMLKLNESRSNNIR